MARFMRRGLAKFYWLTTVAGSRPTRPEITAGKDITALVAEVSGFMLANNPIPTPDMGSAFTSQVPGEDTAETSTLTLYEDDAAVPTPINIDTVFAKNITGYLVIMRKGDVATSPSMDTFWCRVASKGPQLVTSNDPARTVVTFAILKPPDLDGVIP